MYLHFFSLLNFLDDRNVIYIYIEIILDELKLKNKKLTVESDYKWMLFYFICETWCKNV